MSIIKIYARKILFSPTRLLSSFLCFFLFIAPILSNLAPSAILMTSSTLSTGKNFIEFLISSGNSGISFALSFGMITFRIPTRCAASDFSFNPPIGRTSPRKVISPVIAMPSFGGLFSSLDTSAAAIVIPADGPSFGIAPAGTWI